MVSRETTISTNRTNKPRGPIRRTLKLLAWLVGVLIVLLVVGIVALVFFFDPNNYKPQIDKALAQQIGRPVKIQGQIHWSFYPWLDIRVGQVTVANAKGFGSKPLASIDSAAGGVRLIPLLGGNIKIGEVSLDGLTLRLTRHANGQTNYQSVIKQISSTPGSRAKNASANTSQPKQSASQSSGSFFQSLAVQSVAVQNAAIIYSTANTTYRLHKVSLHTGVIQNKKPFKLKFGAQLEVPHQKLHASLIANAQIKADLNKSHYRVDPFHVTLTAKGPSLPNGKQQASLDGGATLDMEAGTLTLKPTTLKLAGLIAKLHLNASKIMATPSVSGSLTVQPFNPRQVLRQLGQAPGAGMAKGALTNARLNTAFKGSPSRITLKPIDARLDQTNLNGSASANLAQNSYTFDLNLTKVNLDRYGLTSGGGHSAGKTSSGAPSPKQQSLDLSFLRGLALKGQASIDTLIAEGMTIHNANVNIRDKNGVLNINPLKADLYGGHLGASAQIDARQGTPRYTTKVDLVNVAFQPLLKDLMNTSRFAGRGNFKLNLDSAGNTVPAIERKLNGTTQINVKEGALHGIDVREGLVSAVQGHSFKKALAASKSTIFHHLSANFKVHNGVVRGHNLTVNTSALGVKGRGQYDLPKNDLDYTVNLNVPPNANGTLAQVAGLSVPVHLTGALTSPHVSLDMQKLIRAQIQNETGKNLNKLKQSLGDKLKQQLGNAGSNNGQGTSGSNNGPGNRLQQSLSHLFGK